MHNVEAVEVFDGVGQIVEHAAGVSLRVSVGGGDGVEEVSPLRTNPHGGVSVRNIDAQNLTDSPARKLLLYFSEKS